MKRVSFIGPLLLILIGGLFLAHNLRPELPILRLVSEYWPFLLIGWGFLRLIEILYARIQSRPLPAAGIGGGEWFLVSLVVLIGMGMFFGYRHGDRWPQTRITRHGLEIFAESYDYPLAASKPVGKSPRILVENLRGNARITAADTEELKVTGRSSIRAFQKADADSGSKECPLEILVQGDQIVVRTNQDRLRGTQRISSDLEISVPRGASVQGRGHYGDFEINGILGSVAIDSENAGVRLHNIGGSARIDLRRSDIVRCVNIKGTVEIKGRGSDIEVENIEGQVTVNGSYTGELLFRNIARPFRFESSYTEFRAERVPGQVRISLGELTASDLVGPLRLTSSRAKDVQLGDFTEAAEISLERGDIELRPRLPVAKMEVRTGSGDVELALPDSARFDLRASTNRGEAINDFGAPLQVESESAEGRRRGSAIRGAVGSGPTLNLITERGTITIRKSVVEPPRPPSPPATPPSPKAPGTLKVEKQ